MLGAVEPRFTKRDNGRGSKSGGNTRAGSPLWPGPSPPGTVLSARGPIVVNRSQDCPLFSCLTWVELSHVYRRRSDHSTARRVRHSRDVMVAELNKVIIGQREVIEQILAAIFTRGHVLLVGVPGLAKTLMVSSIARILDVGFKRIQFTPDLMPSDITGTNVLEEPRPGGGRSGSSPGRSSPTSSWPTRSTGPRPRPRRRSCRRCRSAR